MNEDDILQKINSAKEQFYSGTPKNTFFKKQQKFDLADKITEQFDIRVLMERAIYFIPRTNKLYLDYPVMKLFVNPNNYMYLIQYTQSLLPNCIQQHGSFECHLNLDTFTATAAERHKNLVQMFCEYDDGNTDYTDYLTKMIVLNTPTSIDVIAKILMKVIEPEIKAKIVLTKKEKSMV